MEGRARPTCGPALWSPSARRRLSGQRGAASGHRGRGRFWVGDGRLLICGAPLLAADHFQTALGFGGSAFPFPLLRFCACRKTDNVASRWPPKACVQKHRFLRSRDLCTNLEVTSEHTRSPYLLPPFRKLPNTEPCHFSTLPAQYYVP